MDANTLDKLENKLFIFHRIFQDVFDEILRFIQYGRGDECLCVIGPTGVGKSKMSYYLVDYLIRQSLNGWRPGSHDPITIEAPAKSKNGFPWSSFIEELLMLLGEKDIRRKVDLDEVQRRKRDLVHPPFLSGLSAPKLESLVRLRVEQFKPSVILIDEAQNLVDDMSRADRKTNVNRLKSWANRMETKFVLFGTHESKYFLDLNEQLSRRVAPIYFPRYAKTEVGLRMFAEFYLGIKDQLGLVFDPKIEEDFEDIYNYSLGCPGLLVTWIHHSISRCITSGQKSITKSVWDSQKLSSTRLTTIERAIKNFELEYEKSIEPFNPDNVFPDEGQIDLAFKLDAKNSLKAMDKRPGMKKPKRHPVRED